MNSQKSWSEHLPFCKDWQFLERSILNIIFAIFFWAMQKNTMIKTLKLWKLCSCIIQSSASLKGTIFYYIIIELFTNFLILNASHIDYFLTHITVWLKTSSYNCIVDSQFITRSIQWSSAHISRTIQWWRNGHVKGVLDKDEDSVIMHSLLFCPYYIIMVTALTTTVYWTNDGNLWDKKTSWFTKECAEFNPLVFIRPWLSCITPRWQ